MAVKGNAQFIRNLLAYEDKVKLVLDSRMKNVARALEGWAKTEHSWQNQRPHTESTIRGYISEVSDTRIVATLSADYDAALWLELFHDGEWSWLWAVMVNHKDEILEMLGATNPGAAVMERNPDIDAEKEAAKQAMYADRASRRTK